MSADTLPKVDLHLHLDGSFRPATVLELARSAGVPLPAPTAADYLRLIRRGAECGSVNEYLRLFDFPLAVMQRADALSRVTRELIEDLSAQGLWYAEIRFAPQLHVRGGLSQMQAVEAVLEGRRQAMAAGAETQTGILLCMMCLGEETVNRQANAETAALAAAYLGRGVAGLDLAGAEGIVPLRRFAPLFSQAQAAGVPCTCHAGDSQGPDTVRDALDFGVRRIGHGHRIFDDPALCRRAAETGVALEICPTSNIQCRTQPSYAAHPARLLLGRGVAVTINTDNMTLAGVTLEDEYRRCREEMGFSAQELARARENALAAAFLAPGEREALLRRRGR